jgi:hypothetical protein
MWHFQLKNEAWNAVHQRGESWLRTCYLQHYPCGTLTSMAMLPGRVDHLDIDVPCTVTVNCMKKTNAVFFYPHLYGTTHTRSSLATVRSS